MSNVRSCCQISETQSAEPPAQRICLFMHISLLIFHSLLACIFFLLQTNISKELLTASINRIFRKNCSRNSNSDEQILKTTKLLEMEKPERGQDCNCFSHLSFNFTRGFVSSILDLQILILFKIYTNFQDIINKLPQSQVNIQ